MLKVLKDLVRRMDKHSKIPSELENIRRNKQNYEKDNKINNTIEEKKITSRLDTEEQISN